MVFEKQKEKETAKALLVKLMESLTKKESI